MVLNTETISRFIFSSALFFHTKKSIFLRKKRQKDSKEEKNINVNSTEFGVFAFAMHYSGSTGSIHDINMQNVNMCGKILTAEDRTDPLYINNKGGSWFNEFTIS